MSAYLIVRIAITDWSRYREYTARTPAVVAQYGGRFIVRGGEMETLEGPDETRRVVVIEFPTLAQAKTFFQSAEYTRVKQYREGAANGEFLAIAGCDG